MGVEGFAASGTRVPVTRSEFPNGDSFERHLEHVPALFAVTRGPAHTVVYANAAFRRLAAPSGEFAPGKRVTDVLPGLVTSDLTAVLDRVMSTRIVERDQRIDPVDEDAPAWSCTVWPEMNVRGRAEHLVIEFRIVTRAEATLALQREVAERMLLSALHERDIAHDAEAARRRSAFLATAGRQLAESLDEDATLNAMTRLPLPYLGAWCIVDVVERDGAMRRLAIIHPDPAKQALVRELEGRWAPRLGDPFGAPAMTRSAQPTTFGGDLHATLLSAAHDPATLRAVRELGAGPMLTVPLMIHKRLVGALTFVGTRDQTFSADDVELATDLALRSAMALDNARMHSETVALKAKAEAASEAKTAFLGTISHELRTPLNAIGGYVDLIDMGLRGPVTEAQRTDLARIRINQRHLLALVSDVLNFVQVGSGRASYDVADVAAREILADALAIVGPLLLPKQLTLSERPCDETIVVRADPEKATQVVVNLLSNAIKFTPPGGRITVTCAADEQVVLVRVADTGVGIPPEKLEAIFEPFVQVRTGLASRDGGVGLGLAISRNLARAMGGDVTVETEPGTGSTFTLRLPKAKATASGGLSVPDVT